MNTNPNETDLVSETTGETLSSPTVETETSGWETLKSRVSDWRRDRSASAETVAEQRRLLETRQREEEKARRDAASAAARAGRQAAADRQEAATDNAVLAPIPDAMVVTGIWADRAVAGLQRLSPLLVSGAATMIIGMEEPLNMSWPIALAFTLSLEGSLWSLQRLREQFRLEGDGTFSLAMAIYGIIALIFFLVGGHAIWKATGSQPINISVPGLANQVPLSVVVPGIAVALMSAIGVFVWAKNATFKHRARLRAQGRLDAAAPKFAVASWFFCPWETFWSLRHAIKYKLSSPLVAVADWRLWKMCGKPQVWPEPSRETVAETSRPRTPIRVVSTTGRPETSPASLPSAPRLLGPSLETSPETDLETGDVSATTAVAQTPVSAPPANRLQGDEDPIETVGRLHLEGNSYADIGAMLGISKSQAGKRGAAFYKRNGAALSAAASD